MEYGEGKEGLASSGGKGRVDQENGTNLARVSKTHQSRRASTSSKPTKTIHRPISSMP